MKSNGRWRARQLRRLGYSESSVPVIMLYNEICVPQGFWPVNAYSEKLQLALLKFDYDLAEYRKMFFRAVEERRISEACIAGAARGCPYITPRGAKLIRILWNNY
jgi:hypothetical protein